MTIVRAEPARRRPHGALPLAAAVAVGTFVALCGCESMLLDAEKGRIYVEQINRVPQMPGCASKITDEAATRYVVDLTMIQEGLDVTGWFLIRNDSLDGFVLREMSIETSVAGEDEPLLDLRSYQAYVPPGNGGMVSGVILARAANEPPAAGGGCPRLSEFASGWTEFQALLEEIDAQGVFPLNAESSLGFKGFTTSGLKEAVLPVFEVEVVVCCGCLLQMANCADECGAFCVEPEEGPCAPGVGNSVDDAENAVDCRAYFHDEDRQWTEETVLPDGGVVEETVGCEDCPG